MSDHGAPEQATPPHGPADGELPPSLDEEQVARTAGLVLAQSKELRTVIERLRTPEAGSPLAGDDRVAHPHTVSSAAGRALNAATEHLDALHELVVTARVLHPTAPFTLLRTATETASTAVWLLTPRLRAERVLRSLQLSVQDAIDGTEAAETMGVPTPRTLLERRGDINSIATAARVGTHLVGRPKIMTIIRTADDAIPAIGVLAAWRMCSGFAHGRLWPTVSALDREEVRTAASGDMLLRVTNSSRTFTWAAMTALNVAKHGADLYVQRSASPYRM